MTLITDTDQISRWKSFIRDTLGCGCPDEVFESIDYSQHPIYSRLLVGNRLLIYLNSNTDLTEKGILDLVNLGRNERDQQHYNRFRLVVTALSEQQQITGKFAQFIGADDKIHLHFLQQVMLRTVLDKYQ